ncbi:MAG: NAD-dependent epimerase/dehydratase family protein, partial [Candidatus Puniceispirillaceae bacterium]
MNGLVDKFLVDKNRFNGTVMITGAGGCIGAWVVAILTASEVPVVALDLSEDRRRVALLMGEGEAGALDWVATDITDFLALEAVAERYDAKAIIHLAGLQVPFCAASPALGARVNVEGTINILQLAREMGIKRTAYASSIASLALPPGGPYKETLYGAYKLANEHSAFVYWS